MGYGHQIWQGLETTGKCSTSPVLMMQLVDDLSCTWKGSSARQTPSEDQQDVARQHPMQHATVSNQLINTVLCAAPAQCWKQMPLAWAGCWAPFTGHYLFQRGFFVWLFQDKAATLWLKCMHPLSIFNGAHHCADLRAAACQMSMDSVVAQQS